MTEPSGYGFRHDPVAFAERSPSLQAAMVRRLVLASPKPGDERILAQRIQVILADQQPDGALSNHELHALLVTGSLLRYPLRSAASFPACRSR